MAKVTIIIISYNSFEDTTKPCLDSIYSCKTGIPFQTVIIDNASAGAIVKQLKDIEQHYHDMRIIYNTTNEGFAGGNNIGITSSTSDYYVLLNNDTIVTDHWLDRLISFLEQHPDVGLVGPSTNYAGSEQRIHVKSTDEAGILHEGSQWAHVCAGDHFYTGMLSFFCIAMKHEVIARVGLLDKAFGVGMFEDTDYCLRTVKSGYKIACLEDVFIFHKGSKSFNKLPDLNSLFYRNLLLYENKHQLVWEPEHNKYLTLILQYIRSAEAEPESRERALFKIANKTRMLEQLGCGHLFRNYAQLSMNTSASGACGQGLLEQCSRMPGLRYPLKSLSVLIHHGPKEVIKRIFFKFESMWQKLKTVLRESTAARRFKKTRFRRAFVILKEHGWKELARKIKRKLFPGAANPYDHLQLLNDITINVIEKQYEDDALLLPFSVVTTVKNEGDNIITFLQSMENQSARPQEVVIVDGGSKDNTAVLVRSYADSSSLKIKLIRHDNLNIAEGRNEGVRNTSHEVVVFTDAGCRLDTDFCRNLVGPLSEDKTIDLVGGIYHPVQYHAASEQLIPDWSTGDMAWWKSFLPSARSQAVRKSTFWKCGGFPEYLTLTGEDTLFDINYRRFSNKWVYNKKAFVYWKAPTSQEQALRLWKSYGTGDGESGIGDFQFYPHLIEYRKTWQIQDATTMGAFVEGYIAGRENRSRIEIARKKIKGVLLVLANRPFGCLQADDPLFIQCRDCIAANQKVIYVCTSRSAQGKRYFDIDYSMIELYYVDDFDTDEFVDRYRDILEAVILVRNTDNRQLVSIEHKILALQKSGYYKLNRDADIIQCIFRAQPANGDNVRAQKEQEVIDHYKRWFPIEKRQGRVFADMMIEKMPKWLDHDISSNRLSILDFGCSCGHLVHLLSSKYPASRVSGLDIEAVRINKALEYYPGNRFICEDIRKIPDRFDCIFTSNVLEHFENPFDIVAELLLDHLNKYLVILVPYHEMNRIEGHYYTFTEQSFPPLFRDLVLQYTTVFGCNNDYWPGSQILAVYKKQLR